MEPTTKQVKCITRKGQFVPKKIKKGIHCRSKPGGANASVPGSSGGGFSSGASASADTAIAMNTGNISTLNIALGTYREQITFFNFL